MIWPVVAARALGYARISDDREGEMLGVARQHEDIEELAQAQGLDLVEVLTDNDIGASTRSRKKSRPGFDALLARIDAGEAEVILAYSNSRLTRRPAELEDLIRLHERTGVRIITKVSGTDDLSTADGRMVARIKSNVDAAEAERIGERLSRAHLQAARSGAVYTGQHHFGYERDKVTINEYEADLIRDACARFLAGDSLYSIRREWVEKGVPTRRGGLWTPTSLKQVLRSPTIAGLRAYKKEPMEVGGQFVQGQWPAIVDMDTWTAVRAKFASHQARAGKAERPGKKQYMLSGLLTCGVCGRRVVTGGRQKRGRWTWNVYRCSNPDCGRLGINGDRLDELIVDLFVARLATLTAPSMTKGPWPRLPELSELQERVDALYQGFGSGRLGSGALSAAEGLERELATLRAERDLWGADEMSPTVFNDIEPGAFGAMSVERRRAAIGQLIETVTVMPARQQGHRGRFDPERVRVTWRA